MPDQIIDVDVSCWYNKLETCNKNLDIEKLKNHNPIEVWEILIDEKIADLFKAIHFNDDSHIYTHMSCQYDHGGFSSFSFTIENYNLWYNKLYNLTLKKFNLEKKDEDKLFLPENKNFISEFLNGKIDIRCHTDLYDLGFNTIINMCMKPEDVDYATQLLNELY
jgi:hypothetical protein